jgi:hypothetical protein
MWVPGKSLVEMKSKVFNMVLLRDLHIIYMGWWARCASSSERHMDRLSFISFHTPSFQPALDHEEGSLEFLVSSGRIIVYGDDCSVVGKSGCDGVR